MLELVGLLGGALLPFVKEAFGIWKTKLDYNQELKMFELQIERAKYEHEMKIEEASIRADIAESVGLYQTETKLVGDGFIEGLRASVRPVITYAFMVFYLILKMATYNILIDTPGDLPWQQIDPWMAIKALWGEEEYIIFSTIIGFYFGGRTMDKARKHYSGKR